MGADYGMHRARHMEYKLVNYPELLSADTILSSMDEHERSFVSQLEILASVDSTNLYLMRKAREGVASGTVCLAEQQQAGRGRRGRSWVSPSACNVYLSLLWRFAPDAAHVAGLSIAMGVAVARALAALGIANVQLKWPNDVLWQSRKLAGILIDMTRTFSGAHYAVIGVGLNTAMTMQQASNIDQPWIDMQSILGQPVARNRCAGLLVQHLFSALHEFQSSGLAAFQPEWSALDALAGKHVDVLTHNETISGIAQGIDADGAFKLFTDGSIHCYQSADVSVRLTDRHAQKYATAEAFEQE